MHGLHCVYITAVCHTTASYAGDLHRLTGVIDLNDDPAVLSSREAPGQHRNFCAVIAASERVIYPWIATVVQRGVASFEGVNGNRKVTQLLALPTTRLLLA